MKKRYLLIAGSILVTLALVLGTNYLMSLKKVTFKLSDKVDSAAVFTAKKKEIKRITASGGMMLAEGKYYVVPEGDNISENAIRFTVIDSDLTVTIDPPYADKFLSELLKKEQSAISTALTAKYPSLIDGYTFTHGTLYGHGDWFGGLLEPKISDSRQRKDPYRVVLHKKDYKWQVIRRPEYVLTSSRYEEVPVDILRKINSIAK